MTAAHILGLPIEESVVQLVPAAAVIVTAAALTPSGRRSPASANVPVTGSRRSKPVATGERILQPESAKLRM